MRAFFIVGCPRSGTTALQQALNRHSQIVIPPETKVFYYFYGKSRARQAAHLRRINADLQIDLPKPGRAIRGPQQTREFCSELARLYLERLDREDIAWFGDKTPEHTGHLPSIKQVFPEAKLVFLYRDGRDVALSLSRMPWMHCDVYVGFLIWLYYYHILKQQRERPLFDTCFVRYEDLASNPAAELGRVLEFLDLPFEIPVAEGHGNREGIPQREYAWKGRALEKLNTDRIGVWKRELSPLQAGRLERLGRHALADLGYSLSDGKTHPLPPRVFAALGWGVLCCAARLPLCCLANELAGTMRRCLGSARMGTRSEAQREPDRLPVVTDSCRATGDGARSEITRAK